MSLNSKDIRQVKAGLRDKFKSIRRSFPEEKKRQTDEKIAQRVLNLWGFRETDTLLCYVSTAIEVDTFTIINAALSQDKRVAVPRCIDGTRKMDFYYIDSLDELSVRSFGVLEPDAEKNEKLLDFSHGLCIVPALAFDRNGYRLGFGKGYYDRFLAGFKGMTAGICYDDCLTDKLPGGKYDKNVDIIVTESKLYKIGL